MSKPWPRASELRPYLEAGLQLIPLHRYDARDSHGRERGKSPRDGAWQQREYEPRRVAEEVARDGINAGIRLPASLVVLDVDPRNFPEGRDSLSDLAIEVGLSLRGVPHTVTGSGGHHYWFTKAADAALLDSLPDFPGVEFKSLGRQVVAAGAVHPSGRHYEWDPSAPHVRDAPPLPDALLRLARRPTVSRGDAGEATELTPAQLARTLEQLDPRDFRGHDEWLGLMMACHHATSGEGRQEFIDWSIGDERYAREAWGIGRRWDSLHTARTGAGGRPVTARYLHKVLSAHGGAVARTEPEQDFDEVEAEPDGLGVDDAALRAPPRAEGIDLVVEEMNARHAVVMEGGRFRVFTEETDPVLRRPFYQRSSREDLENLYANTRVEVGDKLLTRAQLWLRHPGRRQYRGVVFDPRGQHDGWLNLWKGWGVEPARGDWSLMQELILEVLCDGQAGHRDYVLDWLAYMVQRPWLAAEVALCFQGEKGTGKGTLGRAAASLAGAHGLHISSPEHLVGRFNSHLQNCVCLFADEAFWAGDKAGESKLKQLVTEPTITYEGKGRDAAMGKNLIHIVMASNSQWVVPAGLDGERRFAVFSVNTRRQGDVAFFRDLNRQTYEEGGLAAMLYDLLQRDLGDWAPRQSVPGTAGLARQKVMSMDDVERWWYGVLIAGQVHGARGDWQAGRVTVPKAHLRGDYAEYARDQRTFRPADDVQFGMRLARLVRLEATQVRPLDDEVGLRPDRNGRVPAFHLPRLAECRAAFERRLGWAGEWPAEGEDEPWMR